VCGLRPCARPAEGSTGSIPWYEPVLQALCDSMTAPPPLIFCISSAITAAIASAGSSAGLGSKTRVSPLRSRATSAAEMTYSTEGSCRSLGRSRVLLYDWEVSVRTRRERSAYSRFPLDPSSPSAKEVLGRPHQSRLTQQAVWSKGTRTGTGGHDMGVGGRTCQLVYDVSLLTAPPCAPWRLKQAQLLQRL
jgi:hypothetical protein